MKNYVFITGCSSGIGHHLAVRLQDHGYTVLATARNPDDVMQLQKLGLSAHVLDLTSSSSIAAAIDWALSTTQGQLYALINNAVYGQPGALEDLPTAALREQFETNLFGWHELIRGLLPTLLQQKKARIIQISSVLGLVAMRYRGAYTASKFALEGYTDTLRLELKGTPVKIALVEPGPIDSRFRANALKKFEQHIDIAHSRHHDIYRQTQERLQAAQSQNKYALPAEACVKPVVHALRSRRPRVRYPVTTPSRLALIMRRLLPARWIDHIVYKSA